MTKINLNSKSFNPSRGPLKIRIADHQEEDPVPTLKFFPYVLDTDRLTN